MVVKRQLEPELEPMFHPDSYGYRPFKSAHEAVGRARQRCWRQRVCMKASAKRKDGARADLAGQVPSDFL
jgi:retron-type reverse transcriptase